MSVETYLVGAHLKALINAILVAPSRIFDNLFSFYVLCPPFPWSLSLLVWWHHLHICKPISIKFTLLSQFEGKKLFPDWENWYGIVWHNSNTYSVPEFISMEGGYIYMWIALQQMWNNEFRVSVLFGRDLPTFCFVNVKKKVFAGKTKKKKPQKTWICHTQLSLCHVSFWRHLNQYNYQIFWNPL